MFKKTFVLVLLFSRFVSFSQEIVSSFPLDFKGNRDVFQIVNETTKKITLFVSDRKEVKAFSLNTKIQITDSIKSERPEKKYADIAGYNGDKSNPRLFWASENHKEIYSQFYNFENHTVSNQEYTLKLKDEKFVQYFSENNLFYMVTIFEESNLLKFYIFGVDGQMSEKTIDFTGFRFLDEDSHKSTFYGVLRDFNSSISLQKISPEDMTSLTYSSNKRKCYLKNNLLTVSIDINNDFTQLIFIDLNSFTANEKIIKKPYIFHVNKSELNSNSFFIDNKLYQIKLSSSELKLTVKTLDDILIKEYRAFGNEPIDFKNSEILQKATAKIMMFTVDKNKVLEKTSQFLRKVKNNNCAISCYNINGNLLMTLGCVTENSGGMMMPMAGAGMGGGMALMIPVYINPTYDNFNSYKNRRVTYINCLFDKEDNHILAELKPLAFDKIQDFLSVGDKEIPDPFSNPENKEKSKTVFKIDSTYYLGDYDKNTKEYTIRKFED